jgi:predicted nucleic acid-binding protein
MRATVRTYVDSDVLIWYLRGEPRARTFFRKLLKNEDVDLWVGALQRAEIVFFMRAHEEKLTLELLSRFKTADVTQTIVDLGASLYRRWHKSHGTDVNDALLAATAVKTQGRIVTLNLRHYPMPDVSVKRAWG